MQIEPERVHSDEQAVVDEHPYILMLRGEMGLGLRIYAVGGTFLLVFLCALGIFSLAM
jgi:hypothetical protein